MIVTLSEAKNYLGQPNMSDDDTLITALITQAETVCESYTRRSFTLSERTELVDGSGAALMLRYFPLGVIGEAATEVTAILDTDNSDAAYDLDLIDVDTELGLVYLLSRASWGSGRRRWQVTYGGGYDGAPNDVKQAALILIAELYENRRVGTGALGDRSFSVSQWGLPEAARVLLDRYRVPQV